MSRKSVFALFAITTLNLVATGAIVYVAVDAKTKMQAEVAELKAKTNQSLKKIRNAVLDIEI